MMQAIFVKKRKKRVKKNTRKEKLARIKVMKLRDAAKAPSVLVLRPAKTPRDTTSTNMVAARVI
jgi:hypothetical protein